MTSGFDSIKEHNGQKYSGMRVGSSHTWNYVNALWNEQKKGPDRWNIQFTSTKQRAVAAPTGSGVPDGTQYHWFIIGEQRVTKLDANSYSTELVGDKFKLGHKRPHWRKMSYEYPEQLSRKEQLKKFLQLKLQEIENGDG